jgi:hypothetical protein|tara:strand:- start:6307 stop:7866 length:1560 start_codon:yes stop_codon:yes gene_type:complete
MGGFEVGRDTEEKPKDKTLAEAVSYIYEDVKDIMGRGREEAKRNQGIMAKTSQPESDEDDKSSIVSNVTNTARAFLSMLGKARPPSVNPLVGVATGITAGLIPDTGTTGAMQPTVSEEIREFKRIDKPFDYSKVYKQYLEPRLGGTMQRPTITTQTQAALGRPPTSENIVVPTPIGNPTTALLEQISRGEGSSYDTVYGYKTYVQPSKKITTMKLGELYDYQNLLIADTKGKVGQGKNIGTSASGKYQITRDTLFGKGGTANNPKAGSIAKELGFDADTFFDADTQEKIGLALLNRRGYQDFLDGLISKSNFQEKLSREFASVADPTSGLSRYKNQPVGTTQEMIFPILDFVKNNRPSSAPQTSPFPVKRPDSMKDLFNYPYPVKRPTNIVVSEDEANEINLDDIPIEQLLDPSTYLFGTNDPERKKEILKQMGLIKLASEFEVEVERPEGWQFYSFWNDNYGTDSRYFGLDDVDAETLMDPSTFIFGVNDYEKKKLILLEEFDIDILQRLLEESGDMT